MSSSQVELGGRCFCGDEAASSPHLERVDCHAQEAHRNDVQARHGHKRAPNDAREEVGKLGKRVPEKGKESEVRGSRELERRGAGTPLSAAPYFKILPTVGMRIRKRTA